MPDGAVKGIEIIGYSDESKSYPMHSFDSSGNASVMHARIDKRTWAFTGENVRFMGSFRDQGKVFAGLWELRSSEELDWRPWMDVCLTKVSEPTRGAACDGWW